MNTSDIEGDRILSVDDTAGTPYATTNNGSRHLINTNVRQKSTQKVHSTASKVGSKDSLFQTKTMNISDDKDKGLDFNHCESQEFKNKESVSLQNGVVNAVYFTNGFSNKPAPDNDGSGSEGGYTTPKKRKARRNSIKNTENVTRDKERAMQQGNTTQESEASSPEAPEAVVSFRPDGMKSVYKADSVTRRAGAPEETKGEPQRKDSDIKTAGASGKRFEDRPKAKLSSSTKEDSWTLFKPPPVFPVDNSSAKIVPKISYASKVKENLNKAVQAGGETLPPQVPGRLSQVPMSAMKTITSASFTNGPISGDGNGCLSGGTFFASAASSIPPAPSLPCGENVASYLDNNCSSTNYPAAAFEMRKCTLFIPLNPLNMQPVLPSARQVDNPAAQTNQKALGDIFQNQWGLSFINEPNVGPDGGGGQLTVEEKAVPVTFQGDCTIVGDQPCLDTSSPTPEPLTGAVDPEKRTSSASGASVALNPASVGDEEGAKIHLSGQEKATGEAKSPGAALSAPCKFIAAEPVQTSLTNMVLGLSQERAHPKSLDRRYSWGSFDLKAAVTYHTKEMGYIISLQKQDPKRVVFYDETQDAPDL